MQDNTIFDALKEIKRKELDYWTDDFHGDEIRFAANTFDAYVGARSMILGMGLNLSTQLDKIKRKWGVYPYRYDLPAGNSVGVAGVHKIFIDPYLRTINPLRCPPEVQDRVILYQQEFNDFVFDQAYTEDDEQIISNYIRENQDEIYEGMEQLVTDTLCKMQNQGAIKLAASLFTELMKCDKLPPELLKLTDYVYDLADLGARNRNRLKSVA